MSEESRLEESKNQSVRTLAAFLGATAIGLLSFTHDVYSDRSHTPGDLHKNTDDAVNSLLFLGFLFSLSVAALRRPHGNTRIADAILSLSFAAIILGTVIFVWGNMAKPVSISFSVGFALLAVGYATCIDSSVNQNDEARTLSAVRRWINQYRGLKKP